MLLKEERGLDAYHTLLEGLHHWGQLELIEREFIRNQLFGSRLQD